MPGNPLVRFDEGGVGRTVVSPSLLLYLRMTLGLAVGFGAATACNVVSDARSKAVRMRFIIANRQ